ncbi:hypothetical protein JCM4914_61280 [Streptomyces platensis subsp. malvinus]
MQAVVASPPRCGVVAGGGYLPLAGDSPPGSGCARVIAGVPSGLGGCAEMNASKDGEPADRMARPCGCLRVKWSANKDGSTTGGLGYHLLGWPCAAIPRTSARSWDDAVLV